MTCSSITITAAGISQRSGTADVATMVPKEEIRGITLSHRSRSRHPFLSFFAGFILVITGLVFLIAAFMMAEGGIVEMHLQALSFSVPVVPILLWSMVGAGLWLILGVFRGSYAMTITMDGGVRTLCFSESADIVDILRFIGRANRELGYSIDTSLSKTMYIREAPGNRDTSTR